MKTKFSTVSCLLSVNANMLVRIALYFVIQFLNLNSMGHFQHLHMGKIFCRPFIWYGSQSSLCGQYYTKQKSEEALFYYIVRLLAKV